MFRQPPDPPELSHGTADTYVTKTHQGLTVDVLTSVRGGANLVYSTHVLMTAINARGRYQVGQMAQVVEDHEVCSHFIPKGMVMQCFDGEIDRVTVIRLPENLFRRALRGVADYDAMVFRYFRDTTDPVLIHASELLCSLALDRVTAGATDILPLVNGIVLRILRSVEGAPHRRERSLMQGHVAMLTKHIDKNLAGQIRLPDLADMVGMSVFSFSREFKMVTNTSPMRFVLERRIEVAKIALATSAPLAQVAFDTGFSSQSHFTTAFRLATGMTPSAWRAARGGLATD